MFNGENLLDGEFTSRNLYCLHLSRILWTREQLINYRISDSDRDCDTDREPFRDKVDLNKINLIKSKILF